MRRKKHRRTEAQKGEGKGKQLAIIIVAAVLAAIPFCYGKYFEFGTKGPFDGSLNVYSAQCVVSGQKLGVEVWPSARPATLLVNVIGVALFGFSEIGPKLIQMLMQLTALVLMFYTLRKVYGPLPAGVALILAAPLLISPALAEPRGVPRLRALFESWMLWEEGRVTPGGCPFVVASYEYDDRPGPVREAVVAAQRDWVDTAATAGDFW